MADVLHEYKGMLSAWPDVLNIQKVCKKKYIVIFIKYSCHIKIINMYLLIVVFVISKTLKMNKEVL